MEIYDSKNIDSLDFSGLLGYLIPYLCEVTVLQSKEKLEERFAWLVELRSRIKNELKNDPNPLLLGRELEALESVISEYNWILMREKKHGS